MACNQPPPLPTKQLTSLFSSTSSLSSSSFPTTSTPVQSEKQVYSRAASSICKSVRRRNGGATATVLFLVLLDLWGVVPIIILITTTGIPTTVSAVSIAAVSIASNAYGDGKGNGMSGNFDNQQQQHNHHQPGKSPQPHKLSFLTGNDTKGNGSTVGVLNLSFGELAFANKRQQQHMEASGKPIKTKGSIVKRNVGDTRITSNQDVTTLALAVENSTSVAIANINSSFNNVNVFIGPNSFPNRYESGNRYESHSDDDYNDF